MILSTIAAVCSVAVITQGALGASNESKYFLTRHCNYDNNAPHCYNYWTAVSQIKLNKGFSDAVIV